MFDFLAGLDSEYDSIRIQILGKDPLPSFSEVYSYIQEEEDRHHAMLSLPPPPSIEKSAFISSTQRGGCGGSYGCGGSDRNGFSRDDRDKFICEHYGRFRHTKDTC